METFDCIESRRSVRKYETKDVPNEMIAEILTAGTYAPSAGNTQEWEFIVVRDREIKEELSNAALGQVQLKEAPVVIVILANLEKISMKYRERGKELYALQDTAACIQNMLLVANDIGLGACWIGAFEEDKVASIVETPKEFRVVSMITLGFPIPYKTPKRTERIPFERLTWGEKYGREIKWFMDYGRQSRFSWKPLDQQIEELSKNRKRLQEEREELEKKESNVISKSTSQLKKLFSKKSTEKKKNNSGNF
jgi:SagB-type dehydrogenase family enzyme